MNAPPSVSKRKEVYMTAYTTFYLSGIIGKEAFDIDGDAVGIIRIFLSIQFPEALTIRADRLLRVSS